MGSLRCRSAVCYKINLKIDRVCRPKIYSYNARACYSAYQCYELVEFRVYENGI